MNISVGSSPVTEHCPFRSWRRDGQLERCVEVMLLFIGAMNHLTAPHHHEARVTKVTGVQSVTPPIQNHDAGCAAAYTTRQGTYRMEEKSECWCQVGPMVSKGKPG